MLKHPLSATTTVKITALAIVNCVSAGIANLTIDQATTLEMKR